MRYAEDIVFQEGPSNVTYEIGRNAFLECAATGQPQPAISWRFDKEVIPAGNHDNHNVTIATIYYP